MENIKINKVQENQLDSLIDFKSLVKKSNKAEEVETDDWTPLEKEFLKYDLDFIPYRTRKDYNYLNKLISDDVIDFHRACVDFKNAKNLVKKISEEYKEKKDLAYQEHKKICSLEKEALCNAETVEDEARETILEFISSKKVQPWVIQEEKNISLQQSLTYSVEDISKIPLKYLKVDDKKIKDCLNKFGESLPDFIDGIEVKKVNKIRVSNKN